MQKFPPAQTSDSIFKENELAARYKVSASLLRKLRREGKGPRFVRFGKCVRYFAGDIADWLAERREPTLKPSASLQK